MNLRIYNAKFLSYWLQIAGQSVEPSPERGTETMQAKETTKELPKSQDVTKDAGRVKIGAGTIQFDAPATKDSGRVRFGAGTISF